MLRPYARFGSPAPRSTRVRCRRPRQALITPAPCWSREARLFLPSSRGACELTVPSLSILIGVAWRPRELLPRRGVSLQWPEPVPASGDKTSKLLTCCAGKRRLPGHFVRHLASVYFLFKSFLRTD